MVTVVRKYEAEIAHRLNAGVPEKHKCRRLHGHRYIISVAVEGELDANGMVLEYGVIDSIFRILIRYLDHYDLNSLPDREGGSTMGMKIAENPTVERVCEWLALGGASMVASARPPLTTTLAWVRVEEDSRSYAEWRP